MRVAAEHVATGAQIAQQVIAAHPDSYLGYRVAADYYALRAEWALFDAMILKIEETRPESNRLLFLRGTAAMRREQDRGKASSYFQKAVERDPKFARAQAHLMIVQISAADTFEQYERLEKINPRHQIVRWAGNVIEEIRTFRRERAKARRGS